MILSTDCFAVVLFEKQKAKPAFDFRLRPLLSLSGGSTGGPWEGSLLREGLGERGEVSGRGTGLQGRSFEDEGGGVLRSAGEGL